MPTDPARTCLECGVELPAGAAPGQCPNCLLGLGLVAAAVEGGGPRPEDRAQQSGSSSPGTDDTERRGTGRPIVGSEIGNRKSEIANQLGDYELLEEIGHGGMGVVYRARQKSLNRVVAVKLLLFGPHAPPESVKRFRAEAVATAALQHPNIVAIHEVGVCEGQHFLVMDFVEGRSLAKVISDFGFRISDFKRSASYLKTIAEAIHYAHERGLLHRDLKPSNILIDANDHPRVTDFGLAKRLEGDSELTVSGQVLGSPNYMPPEQATGKRGTVSRRSDVYALGAILYHALTGRPPFVGEGLADTVQQVLNVEPVSLRVLNPRLPADLETVCLKCLEKEPAKRYATAQLLAEELGRFLEGKPVLARPVGRMAKGWRWCQRNPRLALATGAALLSLLIGLAGVTWQWRRAEAGQLFARRNAYAADINLVQRALEDSDLGRARELLNRHRPALNAESDLRGWEWRYLWALAWSTNGQYAVLPVAAHLWGLAFLPDSKTFLTVTQPEGAVVRWDAATLQEMERWSFLGTNHRSLELSRDGRWAVLGDTNANVRVWDLPARQMVTNLLAPAPIVFGLMFSPGGTLLNCGSSISGRHFVLKTWSVAGWKEVSLPGYDFKEVLEPAFAPDERTVAIGYRDGTSAWWDLKTGQRHETFDCESPGAINVAFSPDGRFFATVGMNGRVMLRDRGTRQTKSVSPGIRDAVYDLAFSPDGSRLAGSGTGLRCPVQLWDVETGRDLVALPGKPGQYVHIGFSPDGSALFAASLEGTTLLWRAPSWEEIEASENGKKSP